MELVAQRGDQFLVLDLTSEVHIFVGILFVIVEIDTERGSAGLRRGAALAKPPLRSTASPNMRVPKCNLDRRGKAFTRAAFKLKFDSA